MGFEKALRVYPVLTKGTRFITVSDLCPKYPLLKPATASAIPSRIPISNIEKPIDLRYTGMTGYNISEAISVKRLIKETSKMVLVRIRNFISV